ncbi:MAG TPA: aldo/keto reductase [Polyangiaceae bacterium]|jgi:aryl-alcohol dehydrogenase-like predicted oxidoreductase|nr:aldo/keto reductase [Polyangiaceae bacterium]
MKYRRLGKTGLTVSEICLGTMTFGSMADEETSRVLMHKAYDAGVDFFDVAEIYPVPPMPEYAGRSEEIVGRFMKDKPRDSIILATKVAGPSGGWFKAPVRAGKGTLDAWNIERAVEASLVRLGTDYIDLYQTHWPDPDMPIEETLRGLERVITSGKVRYVGCSNETAYGLTRASTIAEYAGLPRYETIQNNFSVVNRRFEDELKTVCRKEHLSLLPYSPLAGGVLSGKYQGGKWPDGARFSMYRHDGKRGQQMTARFVNEKTLATVERLAKLATECEMALPTFAIAWTLTRDFVGSTIIGVTKPEQLDALVRASDVKIPESVLTAIDEITREIAYPMG